MAEVTQLFVGYYRTASTEQGSSGLERQRMNVGHYASRAELTVAAHFLDAGVSGLSTERPGLTDLVIFCKAHPGTIVLLDSHDRAGRSTGAVEHFVMSLGEVGAVAQVVNGDDAYQLKAFGF